MTTHLYNITRAIVVLLLFAVAHGQACAQTSATAAADPSSAVVADSLDSAAAPTVVAAGNSAQPLGASDPAAPPAELVADSLATPLDTTSLAVGGALLATDHRMLRAQREHKVFLPDPQRALWLSIVVPGGGQIYNRKYWKLPIFYGGFLGCMYAFTWNQQMYLDYSQAYLDIMDDNPATNSYITMFPPSYDIESNISRFQTIFKNRKDRFRRWRDLSTFCFVGVYALSIIDAYVDAHLAVFDISPDLSLQWGPTSVPGPHSNIGIGATLNF